MSNEIKVGDKVRIIHLVGEINCAPSAVKSHIWEVCSLYSAVGGKGCMFNLSDEYNRRVYGVPEDCVELIEPKEQPEAKNDEPLNANYLTRASKELRKYNIQGDDDFDWVRYKAELAKEIVLKLIGKNNDEQMLAEYATNIAKSVVENLKKK